MELKNTKILAGKMEGKRRKGIKLLPCTHGNGFCCLFQMYCCWHLLLCSCRLRYTKCWKNMNGKQRNIQKMKELHTLCL